MTKSNLDYPNNICENAFETLIRSKVSLELEEMIIVVGHPVYYKHISISKHVGCRQYPNIRFESRE